MIEDELKERYRLLTNCASLLELPAPWTLRAVAARIAKHRKLVTPFTADGKWELLKRSEHWLQGLANASRSSKRAAKRKKWARSYSQGIRKLAAAHRRRQ